MKKNRSNLLAVLLVTVLLLTACKTEVTYTDKNTDKKIENEKVLTKSEIKEKIKNANTESKLKDIAKKFNFDESETEAFLAYETPEEKEECIGYKQNVEKYALKDLKPETITDKNSKIGVTLFSRMGCPHCLDYANKEWFNRLDTVDGVKFGYISTRGEIYKDEENHNKYKLEEVPSIIVTKQDGTIWNPNETELKVLNESNIYGKELTNGYGDKVYCINSFLDKEELELIRDLINQNINKSVEK